MKRIVFIIFIWILCLSGCKATIFTDSEDLANYETEEKQEESQNTQTETNHTFVQIKESPDKYTAYIKDYVSRNCATIGYESMGGDRNDYVGESYIHLVMITESGEW